VAGGAPHPIAVIIVAAGRGDRFGGPKHEVALDGLPLWRHSFDVFASLGHDIVVVGDVPGGIPGGRRRRDSVAAGLDAIPDVGFVLVHDAARPLVTTELTSSVTARLRVGDVDAVIPVLPVTDTVKRVDAGLVVETVDRSDLVTVQTPQGFRVETLRAAHRIDPAEDVTDDAGLVERLGGTVATVPGDPRNIKVTYPQDLDRAVVLLRDGVDRA
jgi:2-C-methyl-D-erythritol 4-phosphate cytidylyltransferase